MRALYPALFVVGSLLPLCAGCADGNREDGLDLLFLDTSAGDLGAAAGHDLATRASRDGASAGVVDVVVNELYPAGSNDVTDPDWAELHNDGAHEADVSGWKVRDAKTSDLTPLPAGTVIAPGGYLVITCDGLPDGGATTGIHVRFKLSETKGDEFHLVDASGVEVDATSFAANAAPAGKSWARIPDGTGPFKEATPTKGAANKP